MKSVFICKISLKLPIWIYMKETSNVFMPLGSEILGQIVFAGLTVVKKHFNLDNNL